MSESFHIYRSGAGSGKTYTLARSFLLLALSRPNAFRNILGVTFTNKATEEMKSRIVSILKVIASDEQHPMEDYLMENLGITRPLLKHRAKDTLSDVLHQYGRFSIVTIDSFFHKVIRSFAREMGLQGTFTIDLDINKALDLVIDQMMLEIGEPEQKLLRKWLTDFAEQKVEEGKSWDFREDVKSLSKEILKDDFKEHADEVLKLSGDKQFFTRMRKELNTERYTFEKMVVRMCREVLNYLDNTGLSVGDFSRGAGGPLGLFFKLEKLDFDISDARRAARNDISKWLTKANQKDARLVEALESFILPKYDALIDFIDRKSLHYNSVIEVQRYFFTFGILAQVNKYVQKYRDENDVMLIADLPDFLHQIINDSDTPYIYEKVGSTYSHYLIDEFQDTSAFQWENFMPLVKNTADAGDFSMVVGDVKQSIYRFRGGDWELLQNRIPQDIGEHHVFATTLDVNWRSDPNIIHFNNAFFESASKNAAEYFISQSDEIADEGIRSEVSSLVQNVFATFDDVAQKIPEHKAEGHGAIRVEFIADDVEADSWTEEAVARTIAQVENLQRKGYELRDIAILTRYTGEGKRIADAFIAYRNSPKADPDLRYEVVSSEALYLTSSHLVRFLVSLIKWLNDENNTIVLTEWLYEYHRYIKKSEQPESDLFTSVENWESQVPKEFEKQREFLKSLPLYELVEHLIRLFDLNKLPEEFTYLQGFQDAVLDYAKNERGDIPSFLEWWEEVRKDRAIQISDDNNAIKILTIHKAKGLEFPVVILPFLSWSFDHDSVKDNILWCKGAGTAKPFNELPVIPLKYVSNLANTYWAADYYQERLKAYLDNLNLLYVAFTRPVDVLIGFGNQPKKPQELKYAYDLVYNQLKGLPGFDESEGIYQNAEIPQAKQSNVGTVEYGLQHYQASSWRSKVSVQIKGSAELSETVFVEATQHGTRIHDMLSRIKYKSDLEQFADVPERVELTRVLEDPEVASWFDETWEVATEVPILLPGGDFKRIDRINSNASETVVIDFKTGTKRKKDEHQVREYVRLLQEMNFPSVSGYLVYLNDVSVMKVS
ncbi:UvrD-helicase domain-containing protein [Marinoscillum furvescens]|uniref:DNA 3'-5' helicase n=1 Tax=Marinoscillum furvescens DSM 4134 TaxID=1122208 RepID=A0A3D9KZF0_MARFU|nr:UvrD-helicase domain-containing protein [Marinoscillum furvescens]RED93205.1 ATP-dependent exoDNAse (exonuclease V) beta subunit [Marinoscillum furvescens DSM 4134]